MIELNVTADDDLDMRRCNPTRPSEWDEFADELNRCVEGNWAVAKLGGKWKLIDRSGTHRGSDLEYAALWKAVSVATGMKVIK